MGSVMVEVAADEETTLMEVVEEYPFFIFMLPLSLFIMSRRRERRSLESKLSPRCAALH
jgi:hypothetical protein